MNLTNEALRGPLSTLIAIAFVAVIGCSQGARKPDFQSEVRRLFDKEGYFIEIHTEDNNYLVLVEHRDEEVTFSWGWSAFFFSMHGREVESLAEEYGVNIEKVSESGSKINQKIIFRGGPAEIVDDITGFIPRFFEAAGDSNYYLFTKNFDLEISGL